MLLLPRSKNGGWMPHAIWELKQPTLQEAKAWLEASCDQTVSRSFRARSIAAPLACRETRSLRSPTAWHNHSILHQTRRTTRMKRTALGVAAAVLALSSSAAVVHAQNPMNFGIAAGATFPTGDALEGGNTGFHGMITLGAMPAMVPFG